MLKLFQSNLMEEFLKSFRLFDNSRSELDRLKFKFTNYSKGLPIKYQKDIDDIINSKESKSNLSEDQILKLIDYIVLAANHVDQHTNASEIDLLHSKTKNAMVLRWLNYAYDFSKLIAETHTSFKALSPNAISTLAQLHHYYGKALRYQDGIKHEERLIHLELAYTMNQYLNDLKEKDPDIAAKDIHDFNARTDTYLMPIIATYSKDLKEFDKAIELLQSQLATALKKQNHFHILQAYIQLAELSLAKEDFKLAKEHASMALDLIENKKTGDEDFSESPLFYNAKRVLMLALHESHDDSAKDIAKFLIQSQDEKKPGIKPFHIDDANKVLITSSNEGKMSM
jgi:hypothetical protein